jgi:site-specific recombinase XerD
LRHLLATTWVAKGLDTKKLQVLLGHASIATTWEYVDSDFEELRSEYDKLWEIKEDGTKETKD